MKKEILLKINNKLELLIKGDYRAQHEHSIVQDEEFLIENIEINQGNLYQYTQFMDSLAFKYKKGTGDDIWVELEEMCLDKINNG